MMAPLDVPSVEGEKGGGKDWGAFVLMLQTMLKGGRK